jgi:hypothetical protein
LKLCLIPIQNLRQVTETDRLIQIYQCQRFFPSDEFNIVGVFWKNSGKRTVRLIGKCRWHDRSDVWDMVNASEVCARIKLGEFDEFTAKVHSDEVFWGLEGAGEEGKREREHLAVSLFWTGPGGFPGAIAPSTFGESIWLDTKRGLAVVHRPLFHDYSFEDIPITFESMDTRMNFCKTLNRGIFPILQGKRSRVMIIVWRLPSSLEGTSIKCMSRKCLRSQWISSHEKETRGRENRYNGVSIVSRFAV